MSKLYETRRFLSETLETPDLESVMQHLRCFDESIGLAVQHDLQEKQREETKEDLEKVEKLLSLIRSSNEEIKNDLNFMENDITPK